MQIQHDEKASGNDDDFTDLKPKQTKLDKCGVDY